MFKTKFVLLLAFSFFSFGYLSAQTVYISGKGKKYHASDCAILKQDKKSLSVEEAKNKGYKAHKHCLEKQMKKIKMAEAEEKRKKTENSARK